MTIDRGRRIPGQLATDDDDIPTNSCLRPELNISEDGNDVPAHLTIDVDTSQHRNRGVADLSSYARVTENGHNSVIDIPCTGRRAENSDYGVSTFTRCQFGLVTSAALLNPKIPISGQ